MWLYLFFKLCEAKGSGADSPISFVYTATLSALAGRFREPLDFWCEISLRGVSRARLSHPLPVHRMCMHPEPSLSPAPVFLNEPEVKTPIKHLQKETEGNKTLLDTINALIAVGAFIAGVQAQLISVTYNSNSNALGKATNWFGFVGLTLDLIGTSASVVRALLLQQTIRRSQRVPLCLAGQIGVRHEMGEQQERYAAETLSYHSCPASRGKRSVHPFRKWLRGVLPNINVEGIGRVPVVSLGGGGLCLLVSMVLFSGASQPHTVWVSCTSIAVGTLVCAFSVPPFFAKEVADHVQEQSTVEPLSMTTSKKHWDIIHPPNPQYFYRPCNEVAQALDPCASATLPIVTSLLAKVNAAPTQDLELLSPKATLVAVAVSTR
ncbi:hypothetical protein H4582DRAFT_2055272 [Lactarius indigo]|nr:hypothetical protein H4582DRAFT_2055272 [Lactarius indigo]